MHLWGKMANPKKSSSLEEMYSICTFSKLHRAERLNPNAKYSVKDAKSRALQHNMHRWYAAILKLSWWASLYSGREGAFPGSPSSFTVPLTSLHWTQQPITVQLNTDDDRLWISNGCTYPVPDPSFHSFSIGSSREAQWLICDTKWCKTRLERQRKGIFIFIANKGVII